jgi:hypothetical protein
VSCDNGHKKKEVTLSAMMGRIVLNCVSMWCSAPGGKLSGKGTIYMSTCRIVLVLSHSVGDIFAFDMPLVLHPS